MELPSGRCRGRGSAAFLVALVKIQIGFRTVTKKDPSIIVVKHMETTNQVLLRVACGRMRIISALNYTHFVPRKLNNRAGGNILLYLKA